MANNVYSFARHNTYTLQIEFEKINNGIAFDLRYLTVYHKATVDPEDFMWMGNILQIIKDNKIEIINILP